MDLIYRVSRAALIAAVLFLAVATAGASAGSGVSAHGSACDSYDQLLVWEGRYEQFTRAYIRKADQWRPMAVVDERFFSARWKQHQQRRRVELKLFTDSEKVVVKRTIWFHGDSFCAA